MDRVLWIGRRRSPPQLKALLAGGGIDLLSFEDEDAALAATVGMPVAAAVLGGTGDELPRAVTKVLATRPEIEILIATDAGIPRPVSLALLAGASGLLDFRSQTRDEIIHKIHEGVGRHRRSSDERELLLRLRGLNEDFLKNVVAIEKRSIELEERLKPEAEHLAATEEGAARILIVDDEEVVRDVLNMVVSRGGHEALLAATGEAAVKLVRAQRFHLVISDKNLPGMSGLDVLREVKAMSPETDFIMMTGYASMESAIEALNQGAVAYLEKPFDHVKKVLGKIEDVLSRQRERNRKRRYLHLIKERNHAFLEQYRAIRADLESWLENRGVSMEDESKPTPEDRTASER
jgi:DNA-binding response OmpR family regulator